VHWRRVVALNKRRGVKRLAIAVGVPWFGIWGLLGYVGYSNYESNEANWWKAERAEDWASMMTYSNGQEAAGNLMFKSILFGAVLPLFLLILGVLGYWVYRGFKPRA
jgi:hypothetical protein